MIPGIRQLVRTISAITFLTWCCPSRADDFQLELPGNNVSSRPILEFRARAPAQGNLGHAFVALGRELDNGKTVFDGIAGYTPTTPPNTYTKIQMVLGDKQVPGSVKYEIPDLRNDTTYRVNITPEQEKDVKAIVRNWNGTQYSFWNNNCVSLDRQVAIALGLQLPPLVTPGSDIEGETLAKMLPNVFVDDLRRANNNDHDAPLKAASRSPEVQPPRDPGSPSIGQSSTDIEKLEYGLKVAQWARDKHTIAGFKPPPAGQLDPFEWQLLGALHEIDLASEPKELGADPTQTQYWGHVFFDELIGKSDYSAALSQLSDLPQKTVETRNAVIVGSKEAIRAAVAQQLSGYLDRGSPWQTLQQLGDRLRDPHDPIYSSAPGLRSANAQLNQATERGAGQRAQATKIQNALSSQAAYSRAAADFRQRVIDYNKKKADFENLMRGRENVIGGPTSPVIPNTPAEQQLKLFINPSWLGSG